MFNKKANHALLLTLTFSVILLIIGIGLGTKILQDVDNNLPDQTAGSNMTNDMLAMYQTYTGGSILKILPALLLIPLVLFILSLIAKAVT